MNKRLSGIVYASLAALFYAISIPCSKAMLSSASPTMTAAFLYLGAGLGVGIMYIFNYSNEHEKNRLKKKDIPYTIAMVVLDIIAPLFQCLFLS